MGRISDPTDIRQCLIIMFPAMRRGTIGLSDAHLAMRFGGNGLRMRKDRFDVVRVTPAHDREKVRGESPEQTVAVSEETPGPRWPWTKMRGRRFLQNSLLLPEASYTAIESCFESCLIGPVKQRPRSGTGSRKRVYRPTIKCYKHWHVRPL